jgi:hypothetical protein
MASHPSEMAELVIRVAAINRPAQLKSKLLTTLGSFLLQHEALLLECAGELRGMFECGCDGCLESAPHALASHANIHSDLRQLTVAYDLISEVCAEFEKAEKPAFDLAADSLRERMIQKCAGDDTDTARAGLERLLSHPHPHDSDTNEQV